MFRGPPSSSTALFIAAAPSGQILALNAIDGSVRWAIDASAPTQLGPVVSDGMLWIVDNSGQVHAFGDAGSMAATPVSSPIAPVQASTPASAGAPDTVSLAPGWTSYGSTGGNLSTPTSLTIAANGDLWVIDGGNNRIRVFAAADGSQVGERWGASGSGDGQFTFNRIDNAPLAATGGIAFAADGSIFVADAGNARIEKFDSNRNFVLSWTTAKPSGTLLREPVGVVYDPTSDTLLVVDAGLGRIIRYSTGGDYVSEIDHLGALSFYQGRVACLLVNADGTLLVGDAIGGLRTYATDGTLINTRHFKDEAGIQIPTINDIALDAAGDFYVLSLDKQTLYVYDPASSLLLAYHGEGVDSFVAPTDVSIGPDGSVYIVDYWAGRIQKFKPVIQ